MATDSTGWKACATSEGSTCKCTGKVLYARRFKSGKPGKGKAATVAEMMAAGHKIKKVTGSIKCSDSAFGDPLPGYSKGCFCKKSKPKKPKKKKNPFTGKPVTKKKTPIKVRVSLTAKHKAAYKTLVSFASHMMKDGAKAKGSKGFFECHYPIKRKLVYYEDWESTADFKAFKKAMKVNIKTLKKAVLKEDDGITAVKISSIPTKAYSCKVWAPKLKGKISVARKNSAVLKAFSMMAVDKVLDSKTVSNGPIGALIIKMAAKVKMTPEIQFAFAISQLKSKFTGGVTRYILDHMVKAMAGKNGLLVVGPVPGKLGNWVHLDDAALGLSGASFNLVPVLSVRPDTFTMQLAKVDKAAVGTRLKRYYKKKAGLTSKDFKVLFSGACLGQGCKKYGKAKCKAEKFCTWSSGWDGN